MLKYINLSHPRPGPVEDGILAQEGRRVVHNSFVSIGVPTSLMDIPKWIQEGSYGCSQGTGSLNLFKSQIRQNMA